MGRAQVIEGALQRYYAGVTLEPTTERLRELAEFIDGHLAPEGGSTEAVLTLRVVRAVVDEALKPSVRRPLIPPE